MRAGNCGIVTLVAVALCACCLLVPGCGDNSPGGAVNAYLGALESADWEAYKNTLNPEAKFTKEQEELARQKFEQIEVKTEGLEIETKYSEDEKKATVTLIDGNITYTAEILGEKKTDTQNIGEMEPEARPRFETIEMEGSWYIDPANSWIVI
jgi:hypothetical protein